MFSRIPNLINVVLLFYEYFIQKYDCIMTVKTVFNSISMALSHRQIGIQVLFSYIGCSNDFSIVNRIRCFRCE